MTSHDYKAIADRLVERGIGHYLPGDHSFYWVPNGYEGDEPVDAETFCQDWRVAGACMERMTAEDIEDIVCAFDADGPYVKVDWLKSPLAIILAYLEAQSDRSTQ